MSKTSHDSETAAHGQQVITAVAFIHHVFNGIEKILLPKRADTKKFLPGVYELPGGHIEFGENIEEGLKREIFEELGVKIKIGDPFAVFDYTNQIKGSHSVEIVYFAILEDDPKSITTNTEDHSTYGWFAKEEISKAHTADKGADDPEFKIIDKGFDLLSGQSLKTG